MCACPWNPRLRKAWLAWILVCLLWGTTYLCIRIGLETIPPFLLAGFRWTTAGALIIAILTARGETIPPRSEWPALTVLGILLLGFGNGAVVWAEQTVPSGLTAVLVATVPFWMVGLDAVRTDGDVLTARRVVGLLVGFAGIVLLVWPELGHGDAHGFMKGVFASQLACAGWAVGSTYARRRTSRENVLAAAALEMFFGGLLLVAVGVLAGEWSSLAFTPRTGGALAYLIVAGSVAGFSAYVYALKHLPIATVSVYAYVNPVIAVVLGTLILKESFSWRMAVAAAIVLAGMALVRDSSA